MVVCVFFEKGYNINFLVGWYLVCLVFKFNVNFGFLI